ncbi:Myosin light chain kinase 3, partial [Frankliniella fusca]
MVALGAAKAELVFSSTDPVMDDSSDELTPSLTQDDSRCPCSSQGREKSLPHTPHACVSWCVSTCMARAGMLTYALPHTLHWRAEPESRLRCVCLCRDRLLDVAYRLPHSPHAYRPFLSVIWRWSSGGLMGE